jgi:hypothetical protein
MFGRLADTVGGIFGGRKRRRSVRGDYNSLGGGEQWELASGSRKSMFRRMLRWLGLDTGGRGMVDMDAAREFGDLPDIPEEDSEEESDGLHSRSSWVSSLGEVAGLYHRCTRVISYQRCTREIMSFSISPIDLAG